MEALKPGHFWKTPFLWTPGCKAPGPASKLRFDAAEPGWLEQAVASVMATSADESDQAAVAELGGLAAARELLSFDAEYFEVRPGWWAHAVNALGERVGFVLLARLKPDRYWKEGKAQGTIYYMGILPGHRGKGYAADLLDEATRVFIGADCWRVFCDTGSRNEPMLRTFRTAGYEERTPWQRPLR
jgi:ribosomal protein S18 acetylase RimI-like enzyme